MSTSNTMLASLSIKGNQPRKRTTPSFEAVKFTRPHETPGTDFRDEALRKLRSAEDPAYAEYIQSELDRQAHLPSAAAGLEGTDDNSRSGSASSNGDRGGAGDYLSQGREPRLAAPAPAPAPAPAAPAPAPVPAAPAPVPAAPAVTNGAKKKKSRRFQNKTTLTWISTNTTTKVVLPSATVHVLPAMNNYLTMTDSSLPSPGQRMIAHGGAAFQQSPLNSRRSPSYHNTVAAPYNGDGNAGENYSTAYPNAYPNQRRSSEMEVLEEFDKDEPNRESAQPEPPARGRLPPIPAAVPPMNPTLYASLNENDLNCTLPMQQQQKQQSHPSAPGNMAETWEEL